jgi:putative thioredoxin
MRIGKGPSPWIFDIDEAGFRRRVLERSAETPVLVDFWAQWCPPCHALAPVLERVVEGANGGLLLAKVEVDDNMRLAGHHRVRGFPTVILFWEGQEAGRFSGAKPLHHVASFIDAHLPFALELAPPARIYERHH